MQLSLDTTKHICLTLTASLPPPPLFLAPSTPPIDPLPPQGPAPSGVSQVDLVEPVEVAVDSGAARGAEPAGAGTGGVGPGVALSEGAEPGGAEPERVEPGGAEPGGAESGSAEPGGAEPERAESGGPPAASAGDAGGASGAAGGASGAGAARGTAGAGAAGGAAGAGDAGGAAGAGASGGTVGAGAAGAAGPGGTGAGGTGAVRAVGGAGAAGPGGARTGGTGAAGAGDASGVGAASAGAVATGGAAAAVGVTRAGGAAGVVAGDPRAEGTGAVSAVSGGAARPWPYYVPFLQQVLGPPPPLPSPPLVQSQSQLQPASPLPGPSPYSGPTRGLTERREPESRPASPESRFESPVRAHVPLPSPLASSLPAGPVPESDSLRAASPTVTHFLATAVTDPLFESTAASALVAELVDFVAACRLDYATSLVAESICPPSVGGECALGTDVLEDREEEFECFAAAIPHLVSMPLAPEGDSDAPDIPTPRSYAEAIEGPYSSQWQAAMDAEMASWKSTGTYVDELPVPGANIVCGMWIFRVKRPPGSPPVFKARYVARGFSQTTLAALGFAPSTADPSLFLRTDTTLPPFYVLVYVDDLVFATADTEALAHVKSELQKRHTCTDLAPPSDESVEPSGSYPELVGCLISSCEAEICDGAMASQELRWLTYLLTNLGKAPRSPPVLYADNNAMLALCQEHRLEHRTKHISLSYFLARELQQRGQLRLAYVASQANTADVSPRHFSLRAPRSLPRARPVCCHERAPVLVRARPVRCPTRTPLAALWAPRLLPCQRTSRPPLPAPRALPYLRYAPCPASAPHALPCLHHAPCPASAPRALPCLRHEPAPCPARASALPCPRQRPARASTLHCPPQRCPALPGRRQRCLALPGCRQSCPARCPALPCLAWPPPALLYTLPSVPLRCPVLNTSVLPCPASLRAALPSSPLRCPVLHASMLPCPARQRAALPPLPHAALPSAPTTVTAPTTAATAPTVPATATAVATLNLAPLLLIDTAYHGHYHCHTSAASVCARVSLAAAASRARQRKSLLPQQRREWAVRWGASIGGTCESTSAGSAASRRGGSGGGQQQQQLLPGGGGFRGTRTGGVEAPGGIEATIFGVCDSTSARAEPEEALHTFTLDSSASRCFFRDSTTVTPLTAPVPVTLADPSRGPVVARGATVLPCPAAPSGLLTGLHLPSFAKNLVATSVLQDQWVAVTQPRGELVAICTDSRTGEHLATFTRRPGSGMYTLTTESALVAKSGQVAASVEVAASCSCCLLKHQTLLWHHRLGHPSLPRLRGMHPRLFVSGLPRSLPQLPRSLAPLCLPCVKGRQRAAPHSPSFPPTTTPLQTLHMGVWGPARVPGQGGECYLLLVVDDYTCYTTVFPLQSKAEFHSILIRWIRAVRCQLSARFQHDLPVLRLHSDRGGEFSSVLLEDFYGVEGIRETFTLPASPQQNGIAECRIGLVMEVACTSIIHAAAPHFLWPFAVRYVAEQLNLWPRVSHPETCPTLRWMGGVGDALAFRVWGALTLVRDPPAGKLSPCTLRCGPAPSGVSQVDPSLLVEPVEVSSDTSGPAEGGDLIPFFAPSCSEPLLI
ncbi:unnamed protein product [Closterium sp. NIES-54]